MGAGSIGVVLVGGRLFRGQHRSRRRTVGSREPGSDIAAVVSRGGRPDLAGPMLPEVRAPTLLIVGGDDEVVLELNHHVQQQLRCPNRLSVVPGATHLFEEPGALDAVGSLASQWFLAHMELAIPTPS